MDDIGWFFFELLVLGYVQDSSTGEAFHFPGGREWEVYVEVCVPMFPYFVQIHL